MQENNHTIPIVIVAGMSQHSRVIGKDNELLWHIPADLKRFKALTLGHPIIMGRKTFESIVKILGKPLPGRTNIVVTRDTSYAPEGAVVVHSFKEALKKAQAEHPSEIHIGGGAEIYQQALPYTDKLYLTLHDDAPAGDTFFPNYEDDFTEVARSEAQEYEGHTFQWVDYVRKTD